MRVYQAHIERIRWLDEEIREAEVLARVNDSLLVAFCHPCRLQSGRTLAVTFECIEEERPIEMVLGSNPDGELKLVPNGKAPWSYEACGRIQSLQPLILDCGSIEIELPPRFRDERLVGETICIGLARLDIQLVREIDR